MNEDSGKKILVIYYTQTGQLKKILDSVFSVFLSSETDIEYLQLSPLPAFPIPWSYDEFFSVFPETFNNVACEIEKIHTRHKDYDLIVLAYQPWYLSPSIPVNSFLQTDKAKELLTGKKIITIIGCRNMWVMAQEKLQTRLRALNAKITGNIVLVDRAPNLISILSIVRWLIKGKQEKTGLIPRAGVSEEDINNASIYGKIIKKALEEDSDLSTLQVKLNEQGAVEINPDLLMIEKNGNRIFSIWASIIMKKGRIDDKKRLKWIRLFKYYLFFVLFLISPIGIIIYQIIKPFRYFKIKRDIRNYSLNVMPESVKLKN